MSHQYATMNRVLKLIQCRSYNELWWMAMEDLSKAVQEEVPLDTLLLQEPKEVFKQLSKLYIRYISIFRRLEEAYDQLCHPQKRIFLKRVLESTMGRVLEVYDTLVRLEGTEFLDIPKLLADSQLTPDALVIPIPHYFVEERAKELEERQKLLEALVTQYAFSKKEAENPASSAVMSLDEAIRILQINERGRQGRNRAKETKELRLHEQENTYKKFERPNLDPSKAAILIQKTFRGHLARVTTKEKRATEFVFIGMAEKNVPKDADPREKYAATKVKRKLLQAGNEQEYQDALVAIKIKMHKEEGAEIREKLQEQVRQWFIQHKEQTGRFPSFPSVAEGGSAAIFSPPEPKTPPPEPKEKSKQKLNESITKKNSTTEKKEPKLVPVSQFLPDIESCVTVFNETWKNRDDSNNFSQKYDPELVKQSLLPSVEKEIRLEVDKELRAELENLKATLEGKRRKVKEHKPPNRSDSSSSSTARIKKKKPKKTKKGDLTHNRSIESLYGELVCKNIIQKHRETPLNDFVGGYNFKAVDKDLSSLPSLFEVKRIVTQTCIIPLGSEFVHKQSAAVKSILLYGSTGTGKTMLTHSVVSETGAVFFDLSLSNVMGKIPLTEMKLFLHMVFKVAKTMAPSVIYIDQIEKIFVKQKNKKKYGEFDEENETNEYIRTFKKMLISQLKAVKTGDRVLLIGNSNTPSSGGKALASFCSRCIWIPLPDHATRYSLWNTLIPRNGAKITPGIDISSLTRVSEGYTAGAVSTLSIHTQLTKVQICGAIRDTLTNTRVQMLEKKPLQSNEFIQALSKYQLPSKDQEAFMKFKAKVSIKRLITATDTNKSRQPKSKKKS